MKHKVISSFIALAFLVLIQSFSGVFRYLLSAMAAYFVITAAYNFWYLKKHNFFSFWSWLRPFLFLAALVGLYFVIPGGFFRGVFLIFAVGLIYFIEARLLIASEQLLFLKTLIAYFGLALAIFAANFYLMPATVVTLLLLGLMTFIIARASLDYAPVSASQKNFFSFLLAFAVLEIGWTLIFLPFHFTVLAVILFNIFYVLWIIIYHHLYHNLTAKKISFHIIVSAILIILTLIATPWRL